LNPADNPGAAFEAFRARVREEPELFEQLCACEEIEALAARASELGRACGLVFTPHQVRDAWFAAGRAWRKRTEL
jgi:hypothetical protein